MGNSSVLLSGGGAGAGGVTEVPPGDNTLSMSSTVSPLWVPGECLCSSVGRQGGLRSSLKGMVLRSLQPLVDVPCSVKPSCSLALHTCKMEVL